MKFKKKIIDTFTINQIFAEKVLANYEIKSVYLNEPFNKLHEWWQNHLVTYFFNNEHSQWGLVPCKPLTGWILNLPKPKKKFNI